MIWFPLLFCHFAHSQNGIKAYAGRSGSPYWILAGIGLIYSIEKHITLSMSIALAIIVGFISLGLGIYALVIFFQEPRPTKSDYRIGFFAAGFLLLSEIAIFSITPEALDNFPNVFFIIAADALALLKIFLITVVGIKLSRELGFRWSTFDAPDAGFQRQPLLIIAIALPALITFSYFFLNWQNPSLGPALKNLPTEESAGIAQQISAAIGVLEFAVFEELAYRGGATLMIYKMMAPMRFRYLISALLANLIWTLSHYGNLDPAWVKYVQIFPLGLLCAGLMRKWGIEYAILSHGLFNIAFVVLELDLEGAET